jgi:hypothetical protein
MQPSVSKGDDITDAPRMYRQAEILLTHATSHGIIRGRDVYKLEKTYKTQWKDYFGLLRG